MDQKTLIPVSIMLAGLLVAGAVFYSNRQAGPVDGVQNIDPNAKVEITIRPVDENDWIKGNLDAQIKLVEYSDTECPFCARLHETMDEVIAEYDPTELAWVYRHLPLTQLHPTADLQANALECAGNLGGNDAFWAYTDQVYAEALAGGAISLERLPEIASEQGLDLDSFTACLDDVSYGDQVQEDATDANSSAAHLGGRVGTPYTVLVSNGELNAEALGALQAIADQYNRPGQTIVAISDDNQRATISGALPKEMWNVILDAALGK